MMMLVSVDMLMLVSVDIWWVCPWRISSRLQSYRQGSVHRSRVPSTHQPLDSPLCSVVHYCQTMREAEQLQSWRWTAAPTLTPLLFQTLSPSRDRDQAQAAMDEDSLSIIEEEMEQLEVSASGDTQSSGGSDLGQKMHISWRNSGLIRSIIATAHR